MIFLWFWLVFVWICNDFGWFFCYLDPGGQNETDPDPKHWLVTQWFHWGIAALLQSKVQAVTIRKGGRIFRIYSEVLQNVCLVSLRREGCRPVDLWRKTTGTHVSTKYYLKILTAGLRVMKFSLKDGVKKRFRLILIDHSRNFRDIWIIIKVYEICSWFLATVL